MCGRVGGEKEKEKGPGEWILKISEGKEKLGHRFD